MHGQRLAHSAALSNAQRLNTQCTTARPRDNRSHDASEGRGRGSDLAVTDPELNAGGSGRKSGLQALASGLKIIGASCASELWERWSTGSNALPRGHTVAGKSHL